MQCPAAIPQPADGIINEQIMLLNAFEAGGETSAAIDLNRPSFRQSNQARWLQSREAA